MGKKIKIDVELIYQREFAILRKILEFYILCMCMIYFAILSINLRSHFWNYIVVGSSPEAIILYRSLKKHHPNKKILRICDSQKENKNFKFYDFSDSDLKFIGDVMYPYSYQEIKKIREELEDEKIDAPNLENIGGFPCMGIRRKVCIMNFKKDLDSMEHQKEVEEQFFAYYINDFGHPYVKTDQCTYICLDKLFLCNGKHSIDVCKWYKEKDEENFQMPEFAERKIQLNIAFNLPSFEQEEIVYVYPNGNTTSIGNRGAFGFITFGGSDIVKIEETKSNCNKISESFRKYIQQNMDLDVDAKKKDQILHLMEQNIEVAEEHVLKNINISKLFNCRKEAGEKVWMFHHSLVNSNNSRRDAMIIAWIIGKEN